jgi:hypothetical protein
VLWNPKEVAFLKFLRIIYFMLHIFSMVSATQAYYWVVERKLDPPNRFIGLRPLKSNRAKCFIFAGWSAGGGEAQHL